MKVLSPQRRTDGVLRRSVIAAIVYSTLFAFVCLWLTLNSVDFFAELVLAPRVAGLSVHGILIVTNTLWLILLALDAYVLHYEQRERAHAAWVGLFLAGVMIAAVQVATVAMKAAALSYLPGEL